MELIDKSAVVAEIESLLNKGRYHEEYDCAYRDGNNGALYALKGKLDTLEVKEVPEWKRATEDKLIGCLVWDEQRHFHLYNDRVFKGELYISMGDILELPNSPIKNKYDRQREKEHYQ